MNQRNKSVQFDEFLKMAAGQDFVVLDTETTGLHEGEICSLAVIDSEGETLIDTYLRTCYPIPPEATQIHGITDEMVKNAPTWRQLFPQVRYTLIDRNVLVYNAVYDRKMLHQTAERWELPKTDWKEISTWYCVMEAYAEHFGDWNAYRSSYTWQRLTDAYTNVTNQTPSAAHNALQDCLMTLDVIRGIVRLNQ